MSAAPDKTKTEIVKPAPLPPRKPRLPPHGLSLAESVSVTYAISLPPETPFEAVFDREFWMHVGTKLRPGFFIDVHADDGSYYAKLYVRSAHRTGAQVALLAKYDLVGTVDPSSVGASSLRIEHRGVNKMFCIMSGNNIVQAGFQTQEDAMRGMAEKTRELAL